MSESEALEFYDQNYDWISQWILTPGTKIVLGDLQARQCRFCGRERPEATFSSEAHAIPELLGNRSLFTAYECDECNSVFGEGIENHLGNWSKPARTFARVRGKNGIPTLKKGSSGGWRIEWGPAGFDVRDDEDGDASILKVDEIAKTLTLRLRRDTHTPVEVLKAFVKIGISLLPAEEVENFRAAIEWIGRSDPQSDLVLKAPVLRTFRPGPTGGNLVVAFLLRRKAEVENLPYVFLVLSFGNEVFQVALPSPEREPSSSAERLTLPGFPVPMPADWAACVGPPQISAMDLRGREPVTDAVLEIEISFETMTANDAGD